MNGFTTSEQFALSAVEGWLLLGSPEEAEHELKQVDAAKWSAPEVLCLRWAIHYRFRRWAEARAVARLWCMSNGESMEAWIALANSMRESDGLLEAKKVLLEASRKFQSEWVISYNLACYCAQMGEIAEAILWLNKALSLDKQHSVRKEAAGDADLAPLWEALTQAEGDEESSAKTISTA